MNEGHLFGRGMSFPPRVGTDGRIQWSQGEVNIRESITIILMTQLNERLGVPEFGGGLNSYLFEPNTANTRTLIQKVIAQALTNWEPRITLDEVSVEADPNETRAAIVTISYSLVATQARQRLSFNLILGS